LLIGTDERRVRVLADAHDQVLHAAHPLSSAVDERALDDP
jgi:hypothetical protein